MQTTQQRAVSRSRFPAPRSQSRGHGTSRSAADDATTVASEMLARPAHDRISEAYDVSAFLNADCPFRGPSDANPNQVVTTVLPPNLDKRGFFKSSLLVLAAERLTEHSYLRAMDKINYWRRLSIDEWRSSIVQAFTENPLVTEILSVRSEQPGQEWRNLVAASSNEPMPDELFAAVSGYLLEKGISLGQTSSTMAPFWVAISPYADSAVLRSWTAIADRLGIMTIEKFLAFAKLRRSTWMRARFTSLPIPQAYINKIMEIRMAAIQDKTKGKAQAAAAAPSQPRAANPPAAQTTAAQPAAAAAGAAAGSTNSRARSAARHATVQVQSAPAMATSQAQPVSTAAAVDAALRPANQVLLQATSQPALRVGRAGAPASLRDPVAPVQAPPAPAPATAALAGLDSMLEEADADEAVIHRPADQQVAVANVDPVTSALQTSAVQGLPVRVTPVAYTEAVPATATTAQAIAGGVPIASPNRHVVVSSVPEAVVRQPAVTTESPPNTRSEQLVELTLADVLSEE
jgi:hypothetical protein